MKLALCYFVSMNISFTLFFANSHIYNSSFPSFSVSSQIHDSYLVLEGRAGQPKMMSVGLHCRLSRPGRVAALAEFVDYAKSYGREVWITTRESIANHWYENHLPRGCGNPILTAGKYSTDSPSTSVSTSSFSLGNGASSRLSFLGNLTASSEEFKSSTNIKESKSEETKGDVI